MNEEVEIKKIEALLEMGLKLIDERAEALSEMDAQLMTSIDAYNDTLKSTESLLTLIILAIDGRVDDMLKEADSVVNTKKVL